MVPQAALRASKLFADLSDAALASAATSAARRHYLHGQAVWREAEPARQLAIVAHGLVKLVYPGTGLVGIVGAREAVGAISSAKRTYDAVVLSDAAELLFVEPKVDVRVLYRALVDHARILEDKIAIVSAGSVDRRLVALLAHLADRFGDEMDDGSVEIPVALSRSELASFVGTTTETVIRIMSRWQKSGLAVTTETGFRIPRMEALLERRARCAPLGAQVA